MKTNQINIFMGNSSNAQQRNTDTNDHSIRSKKNVSKNTNNALIQDSVLFKKKSAQKKAMRVLISAFHGEQRIDSVLKDKRTRITELQQDSTIATTELANAKDRMEQLRTDYGISVSSQEQSDLELLLKNRAVNQPSSTVTLTSEESKRLSEIFKSGHLTDYQTQSLRIDISADIYRKEILTNQKEISDETYNITSIKLERLKTHVIADAEKLKESIENKSSKEILGMLFDESKDHIDQERKDAQELADKKAEEEKAQEDKLEKDDSEKREETNAEAFSDTAILDTDTTKIINTIQQDNQNQKIFEIELKKALNQEKLLEEDIKGLAIDQEC